jgi:hypothetical protein
MLLPLAGVAGLGLLLLLSTGGKKRAKQAPLDPILSEAALTAQPGEVPIRDMETGDVILVQEEDEEAPMDGAQEIPPGVDPDLDAAAAEAGPGEVVVQNEATGEIAIVTPPTQEQAPLAPSETQEVPPGVDPDLDAAAAEAGPGEVVVQNDATGEIAIVTPDPGPTVPAAVELPEMAIEGAVPEDSLDLVQALLAAEHLRNWRDHHKNDVKNWQASRGMVADGLAGPKTMLALAKDVGVAPIVRVWPKGAWRGGPAQGAYLDQLRALGVEHDRELGQGFAPVMQITDFAEIEQ